MNDKTNPPNKSSGDFIHALVSATVGAVPAVGSFLSEFFVNVIAPPYETRTKEWMQSVADKIQEIETRDRKFNFSDLKENEEFLDAIYATTRTAIATSSRIKKEKLLNALQNIAVNKASDKIANAIFLNFIDRFNEAHIQICGILAAPNNYRAKRGAYDPKETTRELIKNTFPDTDEDLINVIVKELYDNGLISINAERLDEPPSHGQEPTTYLTNFGKQFVSFIEAPF